ncbi:MAG: SIMPL domain-containing protein [Woeseia sp.]
MHKLIVLSFLFLASACSTADEPPRMVSVSGSSMTTVTADRALLQMAISVRREDLSAAQADAANVTNALLAVTDNLGIQRNKVDTTGANVRPDYRWNRDKEQQEFLGYIAERQITVTLENLELLGQLVEGAVTAGVNQVSSPQLVSSQQDAAFRDALRLAAEDARANAEVLAGAMGLTLGNAITIKGSSASAPRPEALMMAVARDSGAAESYNPGDLSVRASVSATFELIE